MMSMTILSRVRNLKAARDAAFFFLFTGVLILAQPLGAHASLQSQLRQLFQNESPSGANWSIQVERKGAETPLFSMSAARKLIPASNMKLLTGAAVLLTLGPDYKYPTRIYAGGPIQNGVLNGDLLIEGTGDPSLGGRFHGGDITAIFRDWAAQLKRRGIERIAGDLVGLDTLFDDTRIGLNWHPDDLSEWYAAEISALNFNDGCIDVMVRGGPSSGSAAQVTFDPNTDYVRWVNDLTTVSRARNVRGIRFERDLENQTIRVYGSVQRNKQYTRYVTAPNPTLYCLSVIEQVFEAEGIQISGEIRRNAIDEQSPASSRSLIYTHQSPPLLQLVEVCLRNSQNLYSEHFLKTLGAHYYGVGSYETGTLALKDVLFEHGCEIDGIYIGDGSGLSRESRISAQSLIALLEAVAATDYGETFFESLPVSGESGTLRRRMRGTDAQGRVHAKTGTLNGVRALSGYIQTQGGETYLFSMLANGSHSGYRFTQIMDDACEMIAAQ